ncbi:D-glycero-beta-D-manno-heptose 1-phosphate adenylyltransferase [Vallicoccus soli]|uniref:D-glycero-beta-D-manno-heptose 1-phosphate adenylyltransferase n=1 Tax=Vallicoccus soli TaxID=2339232 RepID=A0A3A3YV68_9ACTN|nr:D-glycero-beta-D-manno-heptose 1-phosphate adenylyltransferase [Vallicoccus soli]RJK95451.1 D-glycero-beta-D-manno-heptose 1-phosphate adenylyltransferase [Vallicoccus soli]
MTDDRTIDLTGREERPAWDALLARFAGTRVAVVGETCLDTWYDGRPRGMSREGPVPVVEVDGQSDAPGAAANAARGLAALGAAVRFVSVVGEDAEGALVRDLLARDGVDVSSVLTVPGRRTVAKRRVCADGQVVARFDTGDAVEPPAGAVADLVGALAGAVAGCPVVLAADYDAGLFTGEVRRALVAAVRAEGALLVVDAHDPLRWADLAPDLVKPDAEEVEAVLGAAELRAFREDRLGFVAEHGDALRERLGAATLVVTLDADGAVVVAPGSSVHVPVRPVAGAAPAGAGDTFAAGAVLALAAGAPVVDAARVGCAASSVAVRQPGTAVCRLPQLHDELLRAGSAVVAAGQLTALAATHRSMGRRIVFTNGCFDVLHRGHVAYLDAARRQGDVLVVGVNSDPSVRRLKGPDRPVNPAGDRVAVLAGLAAVDHVVEFDGDTPADLLRALRPDVYVKGGDYTEAMLEEAPLVRELGGEVRIVDYVEDRSTTGLLERVRALRTLELPGGATEPEPLA